MNKLEQVKKLIEKQVEHYRSICKHSEANTLLGLLSMIDSMQEEPNIPPVFDEGYYERLAEKPLDIEIPFGAKDSELIEETITIPEGCYAVIEGNRVVIRKGEEPVSNPINFENELYKAFGQIKDFTLGMRIAKWFYDMGKNSHEPVSEDLKEAAKHNTFKYVFDKNVKETLISELKYIGVNSFKDGAKWQKEKDSILPKVRNRENLDDFSYQTAYDLSNDWAKETPTWHDVEIACKLGAKWQKNHLWKPADGDDLPEIDKEVIVLTQPYPLENSEYVVSFAHRPNPDGWDGKSLTSGKVEHYTPKTYYKGGWNIPDVKYWLDVELPKEIEL